jgi:uncharacterized protein (DUF1778 family)
MSGADRTGRRRPRAEVPRNRRLDLRVSDEELADLRKRAAESGVSIQRLMVDAALQDGVEGGVVDAAAAGELVEARRELARVGNNLNQLVRLAHTSASIELEALAAQGTTLLGQLADAHGLVEEAAARVGRRRR